MGQFSVGKSIPNNTTITKMAFKKGFMHLFKRSLRKNVFQLSPGAYASFEFFLDNFILLFPVKAFVDANPSIFYFLHSFDNFIIEEKI